MTPVSEVCLEKWVILDPTDAQEPIGINVLDPPPEEMQTVGEVTQFISVLQAIWGDADRRQVTDTPAAPMAEDQLWGQVNCPHLYCAVSCGLSYLRRI